MRMSEIEAAADLVRRTPIDGRTAIHLSADVGRPGWGSWRAMALGALVAGMAMAGWLWN